MSKYVLTNSGGYLLARIEPQDRTPQEAVVKLIEALGYSCFMDEDYPETIMLAPEVPESLEGTCVVGHPEGGETEIDVMGFEL